MPPEPAAWVRRALIIGADAISDPTGLQLMASPGVSYVTAIALLGAVGDIRQCHLVAYLGLDPRVRQLADPAVRGRLVARLPLRGFHQRRRPPRRRHRGRRDGRKLVILVRHLTHRAW
jgi:transposase